MMTMVCLVLGVYEDTINVHYDEMLYVVPEHLINETQEYEGSIGQAIRHDPIFIVASGCDEGNSLYRTLSLCPFWP